MKDLLKIRVEGGYLNLFAGEEKDFFVTRQVHDIHDLQTRNGDTTREITIPRDNRNIRLLGYNLPSFKSDFAPSQTVLPCSVEWGGIPVLNDSLIFVFSENLTQKTITIEVLGSQILFFTLLSDDSIRELEFEPQEWTLTALATKAITDSGFLYGNAVYVDNLSAAKFIDEKAGENTMYVGEREVEASGGWFYFHTIVDRILEGMEAQGLSFDTSILDDNDLYQNMLFMLPVTQLYDNYDGLAPMYSNVTNNAAYGYSGTNKPRFDVIESEDPAGIWDNDVAGGDRKFTLTHSGLMSIDLYSLGEASSGAAGVVLYEFLLNGIAIYSVEIPLGTDYTPIDRRDVYSFDGQVGDTLVWQMTIPYARNAILQPQTTMKLRRQQGEFGTLVYLNEWFPDISQKDFIRELFKFFHIVPIEHDQLVTWKYWDKIAEQEYQDLTPFIDKIQGIDLIDYVEGYAQENKFTYTGNDLVERIDTHHVVQMNKRLITEKKDIVKSQFIPCDINVIESSGRVCSPLFHMVYEHVDDNKILIALGSTFFEVVDKDKPHGLEVGDHLFIWNDTDNVTMKRKVTVVYDDYTGEVDVVWDTNKDFSDWDYLKYTKTGIGFQIGYRTGANSGQGNIWDGGLMETLLNWNDVIFADVMRWPTLVNDYYKNFSRSIYNPNLGHVWLNIPIMDFMQLDFMRPVYALGTAYYMNILEQYKIDGSVRAELFRLGVAPEEFTGNFFTAEPEGDINLGDWLTGDDPLIQIYTITNTGANTIRVNALLGGDEFLFFEASEDITLEPAEIGEITISFIGSEVVGTNNCIITFQAQGATNAIRNVSAQVQTIDYTLQPTDAQFLGNWFEGDALTQAYTITNIGTSPITLTGSLSTASTGYSLLGTNPITLQPNESAIQTVQYVGNATDIGTIDCTLIMTESTGFVPVKERGLTVNVYPQQFTVIPVADVNLGDWNAGDAALDQIYSVFNSGSRATVITCVYFGTGWSLVGTNPIPLSANTGSTITFRFSGQPVADVYDGFVDFINEESLTFRRNARANVPAVRSYTLQPVGDTQLNWDGISARPFQRYVWTNTGNSPYIGIQARFTNTNFDWIGQGATVDFDLNVGSPVEFDAQYIGVGTLGNYLATMQTVIDGGLSASRNIACQVNKGRIGIAPIGTQSKPYEAKNQSWTWTLTNTGNAAGNFDIERAGGLTQFQLRGGDRIVNLAPSATEIIIMDWIGAPANGNYGNAYEGVVRVYLVGYPDVEERISRITIPKLKLTPINIPDLGEIAAGTGSTFFPLENFTAAQITGLGVLENDYGGTLTLNVSNYTINGGGGVTNRQIRYSGGNSGQKAVTVIWTDSNDSEVARWSCLVTPIG